MQHQHIFDASKRSFDPTGTRKIRRGFRANGEMNLRRLRANLRQAVVDHNVLSLGGGGDFAFQSPAMRLKQFAGWLENAVSAALDARWWVRPWIDKSVVHGLIRAKKELPNSSFRPQVFEFDHLYQIADQELLGINAALVQKVTRIAANAVMRHATPVVAYREMVKPIDGDIKRRIQSFTHFVAIKSYSHAKVFTYKANGVTHVGINPELRVPKRDALLRDDAEEDIDWVTAGDDSVCDACEDMASGSPYNIDEVADLIPLHEGCRCDLTIYSGPVRDFNPVEYEEDLHPRGPHGEWISKGGHNYEGHQEFVSPNVEHLDFDGAVKALSSERHKTFMQAARTVDGYTIPAGAHERDVIGAWSDGAENSSMMESDTISHDDLKLNAAMKGWLAEQKAVLIFDDDHNGPDQLYQFHQIGELKDIHQRLLDAGLAFHTLIPTKDGADIAVIDMDGSARKGIEQFDGVVYRNGTAEFIGTTNETGSDAEQRTDARHQYEKVISSAGDRGKRIWQIIRDRWAASLAKAPEIA